MEKKEIKSESESEMSRKYKYVYTFVLYFCYFIYAMNLYLTGPSLIDLTKIYKTSISEISGINTVRSFAYTFGAINGIAYQYINRQLSVMCYLFIIALTMALTPQMPSLTHLFVIFAINGFASAGIESAADVWILEMWQQDCGPFVQALHFMFGVGSIMTPLIVGPFLSSDCNSTTHIPPEDFSSQIYIPYNGGALAIAFSASFLGVLYFYKKYVPPTTRQRSSRVCVIYKYQAKNWWKRSLVALKTRLAPTDKILMVIIMSALLMSMFLGLEWAQFIYFPAFAHYSALHVSEQKAAVISSGLAISFTIGRALAIIVALRLRPHHMIYGSLVILSVANMIFLYLASTSEAFMWLGNIVYGVGMSSVYACLYALVEEQTAVNNLIGALFIFFSGITSAGFPIILGQYIQSEPLILVYINILSTCVCFLLLFVIHALIYKKSPQMIKLSN